MFCNKLKNIRNIFIFMTLVLFSLISFNVSAEECPAWDKNLAIREFDNLEYKLNLANREYRLNGRSSLSDQEYDYLKNKLVFLQNCFKFLPQGMNKDFLFAGKLVHKVVHSGLYKAKSEQEINSFLHKNLENGIWLTPKVDGIAISLIYKKGELVQAITRGDGFYGEDVTQRVKELKNIPQNLPSKIDLILQGELYWTQENRIEAKATLSNAREKIFGFLMQKAQIHTEDENQKVTLVDMLDKLYKSKETKVINESEVSKITDAKDKIGLFVWEAPTLEVSMQQRLDFLEQQGFEDTKKFSYKVETLQEIKKLKDDIFTKPSKFPTDGIVLTTTDRPNYKRWTVADRYWSIAWKHDFQTSLTSVEKITFSVGRTGKITPIVYFQPLKIQGRNYSKASLGSLNKLLDMQLKSGDLVEVELAGGIIPKIKKVVWQQISSKQIQIPDFSNYTNTSCMTYNPQCKEQFLARLVYLSEELPIKGVKEGTWDLLINAKLIQKLSDWQRINKKDLKDIKGLNTKSIDKIFSAFQIAKTQTFTKYLHSLGVPLALDILDKTQKQLDLADELKAWSQVSVTDWQKIGLSATSAKIVKDYLIVLQKNYQ